MLHTVISNASEQQMDTEEVLAELNARLAPEPRVDTKIGFKSHDGHADLKHVPQIECADGFKMSVQASHFHYCLPRDSRGPWAQVEVGFPTTKVDAFMPYIDGGPDDDPTATVYFYVPIELVADAIVAHGGFATKATA